MTLAVRLGSLFLDGDDDLCVAGPNVGDPSDLRHLNVYVGDDEELFKFITCYYVCAEDGRFGKYIRSRNLSRNSIILNT